MCYFNLNVTLVIIRVIAIPIKTKLSNNCVYIIDLSKNKIDGITFKSIIFIKLFRDVYN